MALSIKNRELEQISRELAAVTGKPITEALLEGARRELKRQKGIKSLLSKNIAWEEIREIQKRYAELPITGSLTDDEVLGFDEFGVPTK
jgi:antitoxin VapB